MTPSDKDTLENLAGRIRTLEVEAAKERKLSATYLQQKRILEAEISLLTFNRNAERNRRQNLEAELAAAREEIAALHGFLAGRDSNKPRESDRDETASQPNLIVGHDPADEGPR